VECINKKGDFIMAVTYEEMTPIIPHTTMRKMLNNGVHRTYQIRAEEGYLLHDTQYDFDDRVVTVDPETGEEIINYVPKLGYHSGMVSCGYNYDFTPSEMLDEAGNTVTAYGSRKFYTKPTTDVPENQIFGVTNPPTPEVM
jgi:hypothetical protein